MYLVNIAHKISLKEWPVHLAADGQIMIFRAMDLHRVHTIQIWNSECKELLEKLREDAVLG